MQMGADRYRKQEMHKDWGPSHPTSTRATVLVLNRFSGPATLRPELGLLEQAKASVGLQ